MKLLLTRAGIFSFDESHASITVQYVRNIELIMAFGGDAAGKSLQGLDYFAADGTRAFEDLLTLVSKLAEYGADKSWETRTTENLKAAKLYLKGDYKVHLDKVMDVANHCIVFSLSDNSDPDFKQLCDHKHEHICDQCQALAETLTQIERCANDCHFPIDYERDEALYTIQSATLSIQSWK
ncbi:hypothetical protein QZH41_001748 [Actinostola sp. cb2023]|nr:hypothetical protein QZH41_001748 [Actinostola sp. cb2023]